MHERFYFHMKIAHSPNYDFLISVQPFLWRHKAACSIYFPLLAVTIGVQWRPLTYLALMTVPLPCPWRRKPPMISVCLDFLKCVKIFIIIKTQICTENLDTLSVQICVLKKMKIWTHLRKSRRTEIVEGFQLRY